MSLQVDPQGRVTITRGDYGAPVALVFTFRDQAGNLKDLTGATATLTCKEDIDDDIAAAKFQKTIGNGLTNGGAAGTITWTPVEADTLALAGGYQIDLEVVYSGGGGKESINPLSFFVRKDVSTPGAPGASPSIIVPFPGGYVVTLPFYTFKSAAAGGDGLYHKWDEVNDGLGNFLLQDIGQSATYPF